MYVGVNLVLVENVLGVVVREDDAVMGLSVAMELLLAVLPVVIELRDVEVKEAVMGPSVLPPLLELEEELRVLVKVPVMLSVLM